MVFAHGNIVASKAAGFNPELAATIAYQCIGGNDNAQQFHNAHQLVSMSDTLKCPKAKEAGVTSESTLWVPFYFQQAKVDPRFAEATFVFSYSSRVLIRPKDISFLVNAQYLEQ